MKIKLRAIIEVLGIYLLVITVFKFMQVTDVGLWQREELKRHYIEYAIMWLIPILMILASRRRLIDFGISFRNISRNLMIAAQAFIPISVIKIGLGLLAWWLWSGSLLIMATEIGALLVIGWLLRRGSTGYFLAFLGGAIFLIELAFLLNAGVIVGEDMFSGLIFYFLFVGPAEEILFRGFIQTRLNDAFGRPYRFFGTSWGLGLVITSMLFGFIHVLNPFNPFLGRFDLSWTWGAWTFVLGLILGIVRERTGSVLAPALLHGALNYF
ncbi:MAG: type II CAAX endopeptidase family protein [Anaerolineales bacterium]